MKRTDAIERVFAHYVILLNHLRAPTAATGLVKEATRELDELKRQTQRVKWLVKDGPKCYAHTLVPCQDGIRSRTTVQKDAHDFRTRAMAEAYVKRFWGRVVKVRCK